MLHVKKEAGRLQTNRNLMRELEKIKRVLSQQLPNHTITTLLTVDAMLGQNSLEQVRLFHEAIKLDGNVCICCAHEVVKFLDNFYIYFFLQKRNIIM